MKKLLIILSMFYTLNSLIASDVLRTITVVGTGEKVIKPDTVVISTGVDSGNSVIGLALEDNNRIMALIFDGLADLGIDEDQIETNNYNVYLYRPYSSEDNNKEEYRVSNSISINISKLEMVDTVIDTIITLGANKINGIYFTFENEDEYRLELRESAMKDAREKAEFLANIENMRIVNVISISEKGTNDTSNPRNYEYALASSLVKSSVSTGMERFSISYNVTYQIESK